MKLKIIMISMLFSNVVSANSSNYIFNIQNKSYVNAIQVVEESNQEEPTNPTINPVCGISNNGIFSSIPTQLCSVGTATAAILNDTLYEWSCQSEQSTIACSATHFDLPVCGTANGVDIDEKPTTNLCEIGTASSVITTNGVHNWTCQSESETTSCNANQIINTAKHSSCKNMLQEYPQLFGQDGVYAATIGGINSSLNCNMTYQGGGWTLVAAQFEQDPVTNWNEGIQIDYDPSLLTKKGFTLNSTQLPSRTQVAFTQSELDGFSISSHFNYTYTTGNIARATILGSNGLQYEIHRSTTGHYSSHSPEGNVLSSTNNIYHNTLTVDQIGGIFFSYSFSPMYTADVKVRGFGYKGNRTSINDTGAWLIWIR